MTPNVAGQCCPLPASVRIPPCCLDLWLCLAFPSSPGSPWASREADPNPAPHLYSLQGRVWSGQGQSQPTASGWFRNECVIIWANEEEIFLRTSGGNYPCSPEAALGRVALNMAIRWVGGASATAVPWPGWGWRGKYKRAELWGRREKGAGAARPRQPQSLKYL